MRRRHLLAAAASTALPLAGCSHAPASGCRNADPDWPAWEVFRVALMSEDGRVVDHADSAVTTSEGQAYALFFALVANNRPIFDRLLRWTEDNLARGDLGARLPAWRWGPLGDGRWDIIDANAASDADLWLAYTLAQAGRLWNERRYEALSAVLARRIVVEEVVDLPGLGPTLLPGPRGFRIDERATKLNPSYLPPQVLAWFAAHRPEPVWDRLNDAALVLLRDSAPQGVAPDWTVHEAGAGLRLDRLKAAESLGGYNAIRVYLWLGMADPADPRLRALQDHYAPTARLAARLGGMPRHVDPRLRADAPRSPGASVPVGDGPPGFHAAMLPLLRRIGDEQGVRQLRDRLDARPPRPRDYYDQVLCLFGLGHLEGRFGFAADGTLRTGWGSCVG